MNDGWCFVFYFYYSLPYDKSKTVVWLLCPSMESLFRRVFGSQKYGIPILDISELPQYLFLQYLFSEETSSLLGAKWEKKEFRSFLFLFLFTLYIVMQLYYFVLT